MAVSSGFLALFTVKNPPVLHILILETFRTKQPASFTFFSRHRNDLLQVLPELSTAIGSFYQAVDLPYLYCTIFVEGRDRYE